MTKANFTNGSNTEDFQWKKKWKTTSKVIYYWSDLPQILNLSLCNQFNQMKITYYEWGPQISKVNYLNKAWLDFPQNWNSSSFDKIIITNVSKEDDLQRNTTSIIKSEKSQQLLLVLPQFQNWWLSDQTKYYKCFKWRLLTVEHHLKY